MTKVAAQMSVSLDGYYAGPGALTDPRDLAAWMEGPEAPGFFRVTRWVIDAMGWRERQGYAGGERSVDSQIIEETFASAGAYVMGRRMFDGGEIPWGEVPPFRAPVFVVTHRPRQVLHRQGGTSFTFVTDGVERASTWTPSDAPPADSRDNPRPMDLRAAPSSGAGWRGRRRLPCESDGRPRWPGMSITISAAHSAALGGEATPHMPGHGTE